MLEDLINSFRIWEMDRRVDDVQARAMQAGHQAEDLAGDLRDLKKRLRAVETAVETLIRLSVESGQFTEAQFLKTAAEVERGGVLSQVKRNTPDAARCGRCGRVSPPERTQCMWCEAELRG